MSSIDRIAWMWDEALHALEQAERRHRRFYGLTGVRSRQPLWEPPADIFESGSEILISIALPGACPESVNVQVTGNGIVVSAERALPPELQTMRVRRLEIPYGRFERHLELAGGRYVVSERRLADGCLTVRLRKE
ncbi:MAG TPA: Hsp20/alpha crystallin family protein [Steroidobacteraceae bacterium]|nr:Hsp20/alpha crystallin family protein [Steroidobacteraceae bacterium]